MKFKKDIVILKMLLWILFLVLKLCPIQVAISLPLWIKLTMGQLLPFFLCNFSSFFGYVGGIPVTSHFSLLLIDRYILAMQQIITHKEHLRYSFWSAAIFYSFGTIFITTESGCGLSSLKVIFTEQFLAEVAIFRCFDVCSVRYFDVCSVDISSSSKNINSTARVSRLSFSFLWLCFYKTDIFTEYCWWLLLKAHLKKVC